MARFGDHREGQKGMSAKSVSSGPSNGGLGADDRYPQLRSRLQMTPALTLMDQINALPDKPTGTYGNFPEALTASRPVTQAPTTNIGIGQGITNALRNFNFGNFNLGQAYDTFKSNLNLGNVVNLLGKGASMSPIPAGLQMLAKGINTNFTMNPDGTINTTRFFGPEYSTLEGLASAQNLIGYEDMTDEERETAQQNILGNVVSFNPDGTYSTDYSGIDRSLYTPGSDLAEVAATFAGTMGAPTKQLDPYVATDTVGLTLAGLTSAQRAMYDNLLSMGYDHDYAIKYIEMI